MRFDEAGLVVCPIRWFFCDDKAKRLPFHTVFASGNWASDKRRPWLGPGEVKGVARRYDNGKNVSKKLGRHYCGTKALFEKGLSADPTWTRPDSCCPNYALPPWEIIVAWEVSWTGNGRSDIIVSGLFQTPQLQAVADLLINGSSGWSSSFRLHLYNNLVALGPNMVPGDFTEPPIAGYAPYDLGGLVEGFFSFDSLGYNPVLPNHDFVFDPYGGPDVTIYGAWIEQLSDGSVNWVGEFQVPLVPDHGGDTITTGPQLFISTTDTP